MEEKDNAYEVEPSGVLIPSLKIGPITYNVLEVPGLKGDDGRDLYGQFDFTESLIAIDSGRPFQVQVLTLIHEVLHLVAFQSGAEISEEDIQRISYGVMEVIPQLAPLMEPMDA